MKETQKRQGDVLVTRVSRLPEGAKPEGGLVLAKGEATGHAHVLSGGRLFRGLAGGLFFQADEPVTLSHEEHAAVGFTPGIYEVRLQREYFPDQTRRVED